MIEEEQKKKKTVSFKEGDPEVFEYSQTKSDAELKAEKDREEEFKKSLESSESSVPFKKSPQRSGLSEMFRAEESEKAGLQEKSKDLGSDEESKEDPENSVWREVSDEEAKKRAQSKVNISKISKVLPSERIK